jgi:CheY-like chemotaxis protein
MAGSIILVAEDIPETAELLELAFSRAGVNVQLHFVANGAEMINYLKGEGVFGNRDKHPLPTLVLLDLKMPGVDGFDVLKWLRLQPGLRRLLVVVFTSSDYPGDVNRAYELGANSYLLKPLEFDKLQETARYLQNYWLKLNVSPDYAPGSVIRCD